MNFPRRCEGFEEIFGINFDKKDFGVVAPIIIFIQTLYLLINLNSLFHLLNSSKKEEKIEAFLLLKYLWLGGMPGWYTKIVFLVVIFLPFISSYFAIWRLIDSHYLLSFIFSIPVLICCISIYKISKKMMN